MSKDSERLNDLINIILDKEAADHEKDDAAMDLMDFSDDNALNALIAVSQNPTGNDIFALPQYGETIGFYWVKNDYFPKTVFLSLDKRAQKGVLISFLDLKPEWIEKYHL